jgi:transposase
LPEMDRLGEFLFKHIEGIATYCDHPVRFGVVESIDTTIKAVLRRARGMRDEAMLVLKLKWATARPIRSARDVMRFLHSEEVHSLRRRPLIQRFGAGGGSPTVALRVWNTPRTLP